MLLTGTLRINKRNHLELGGVDLVTLAAEYGTPLYVMDEELIRQNCAAYRDGLQGLYPDAEVIYAGKAFLTTAMCRLVEEEGLSLDVASGGEIYTALKADFPPEKIYFHGSNKTLEELRMALEAGVGRIVVDSLDELELLEGLAHKMGKKQPILFRVKPGIEAHTHEYIQTGQLDSKFGLGISDGQAFEAVKRAVESRHIELKGLHCHIGSQIFDLTAFDLTVGVMMDFMNRVRAETGCTLEELDLGGGLGIRYTEEDEPADLGDFLALIASAVQRKSLAASFPLPRLMLEPGRSIVGEAGVTLYSVGTIKNVPGVRKFVSVDGGLMDNIRPALYQAKYTAMAANKAGNASAELVTLAGKACESGDILIRDIKLPPLQRGDLIAVLSTGAYHYSMASNYNRFSRPAVVFVRRGKAQLVVKRESHSDLTRNDLIPQSLKRRKKTAAGS